MHTNHRYDHDCCVGSMTRFQKVKFAFNAVTLLPLRLVAISGSLILAVSEQLEQTQE